MYQRYCSILAAGLSKAGDVALLLELLPLNSETYNSLINPLTKHAKWIRVSRVGQLRAVQMLLCAAADVWIAVARSLLLCAALHHKRTQGCTSTTQVLWHCCA